MPTSTFAAGDTGYIAKLNELANASFTFSKQTGNFAAAKGYFYGLDTTALTVTLPASPTVGDRILFGSTKDTVIAVTFGRNGSNIDGAASDKTLTGDAKTVNVMLTYMDATQGWRISQWGSSGGLAWGGLQTGAFTAVKNTIYGIDGSTFTVTLPAAGTAGDMIRFIATTDARVAITFGRNGLNIDSAAADYVTGTNRFDLTFTYMSAGVGWRVTGEDGTPGTATLVSNVLTLDFKGGRVKKFTLASLNANVTSITYSNPPPTGVPYWGELEFSADGTLRTWPADAATFRWSGGVVFTPSSVSGKRDRLGIEFDDAAANVHWTIMGQGFAS